MKVIYPLVFKFGEVIQEEVDDNERQKYFNLCREALFPEIPIWANDRDTSLNDLFHTSNIDKFTTQAKPDYIVSFFNTWLNEEAKLLTNNMLNDDSAILLIDLRGIDRDQQIFHISVSLNKLLSGQPPNICKAILILDTKPTDIDAIFKHIIDLELAGKIKLIDKSNKALANPTNEPETEDNTIVINKLYPQIANIETFKSKLIRKIGHFSPELNSEICSRYFYDARYCTTEVKKLILEHIISLGIKLDKFEYIFYTSKVSPWVKESLSALSGDIEKDLKKEFSAFKGAYNYEQIDAALISNYNGGHILLVADCINTARSVREAARRVIDAFALDVSKTFHGMSILNNVDNGGVSDNKRIVEVNGQNIALPFLIDVHLEEVPTKKCVLCSLKIPHSDLFDDNYLKLRSHDFWKLSDEGGYEYEILKPEYIGRKRIYVPKFLNWFKDNATYVAYKFENFVNQRKIINQLNRVIIYPDETQTSKVRVSDVSQTASGHLAQKLKELFNYSIIGIPRNIIDQVTADKIGMVEIKSLTDPWVHSIKNIPFETEIIILDEFHKGGKTLESIRDIIKWLDNKANCFFTIADFNPNETLIHKEKYSELEFYNLYEFNNKLTYNEPE